LNPDVEINEEAITIGIEYLKKNPDTGLVVPKVINSKKKHLCKKYPSVFVLFLRSFAPKRLKQKYKKLMDDYELNEMDTNDVQRSIQIASGCFMLYRGKIIKNISGFDPRYFLYMEDFDISIRTQEVSNIVFLPKMKISHFGGNAYKKGIKEIVCFIRSTLIFFQAHGWKYI
jgi:GT2 family glycosyltransferase